MAFRCSVPTLLVVFLVPELERAQTDCFIADQEYIGKTLLAPGYVHEAAHCQGQCKFTFLCEYFTFKAQPDFPKHGAGACLKYGGNVQPCSALLGDTFKPCRTSEVTLQPVEGNATGVVSGPVSCPTTLVGTTLTLPSATGNVTLPPLVPTLPPPLLTTLNPLLTTVVPTLPTAMPVPISPINGTNFTNTTNNTIIDGGGEGGGFPWWAILLLALVVLGVLAVVLYGGCGDDKKKKKKSKSKKGLKEARGASTETSPEVEAPLVTGQAPAPVQEPVASPPLPPPTSQMVGGSVQVAGSPVAEPVTTMSGTYPVGSTGQQVMYSQPGQQMYMQPQQATIQMPVMSVQQQARQPVFR